MSGTFTPITVTLSKGSDIHRGSGDARRAIPLFKISGNRAPSLSSGDSGRRLRIGSLSGYGDPQLFHLHVRADTYLQLQRGCAADGDRLSVGHPGAASDWHFAMCRDYV